MRASIERTQLIQRPVWENPRVHLLDDVWLLTIVAIVIATAVPWFASGFRIDVGPASWGLLALGGIHIAFTSLAAPTHAPGRWRSRCLTLLQVAGVILIGIIWRNCGALQNPLFLLIFALPVIGAIFLSRWHPYLLATVGVLVVTGVALERAPELRWYASGLVGGSSWLTALFGTPTSAAQPTFAGFYAPSEYLVVLLEVFSVMLFACAVAAEYVGTIFERLNAHILLARSEAERGQALWADLIDRLPMPALLVDPDTLQIVATSESAVAYLDAHDTALAGQGLFEVLHFSYPEIIQELVIGSDGDADAAVLRIGDSLRVTHTRVLHVAHKGRRLALLTIEDATETFCVRAALDTSEYAALVIDSRGRVLALNRPASGLFSGAEVGTDAARLLPAPAGGAPWWEPGLTGRRKMHIEIGPRIYQVTSSATAVAGEEERIFTVSFIPVARADANDPFGTSSTRTSTTLGQLR